MKDKSSPTQQILEAIELTDRDRDEASDAETARLAAPIADRPELAELRRRSKRLDDTLRRALRDVPVPEGFAQRILLCLGETPTEEMKTAEVHRPRAAATAPPRRAADVSPRSLSRRRWMFASAGAVAVAAIVAGWLCFWTSNRYTVAQVLEQADSQFADNAPQGERISQEVLESYPPGMDIRRPPGTRWRKVDAFLGREAVAYEMSTKEGTRATLFVVRYGRPIAGLEASPPGRPQRATGGRASAAWQADGMLYVLVVAGDWRDYRSFRQPVRPIA
jgi:hypothetical protein